MPNFGKMVFYLTLALQHLQTRSVYPENADLPSPKATGPQFDCSICMEKQPLGDSIECGCGHLFCVDCMGGYLSNAIREGNVEDIKCPDKDCQTVAQQFLVSYIVSDELYARYEWLLLVAGVKDMPDVVSV
ncbi:unnamed protein product [Oppiella nova]|uniref:RBR-type E3 ubiquitin transferase n=1 Tax=Oppiella nova TaxID=334625 RepID=A0A7R9MGK9_9ACAR|nr:unnamed protein product [Oppiella nova]CAG2177002.1 unnamed protein product [Oppiella nova]